MSQEVTRLNYAHEEDTIVVSRGEERMSLGISDVASDEETKEALVAQGLASYLRRAASEVPADEKFDAIERAYDRLVSEGAKAFQPKPRVRKAPRKAEKVSALAVLRGTTTDAIEEALSDMDKDRQDEVLNAEEVLSKVEELRQNAQGLDLAS